MPAKLTIAYLTSSYARAGDTFVRAEVIELRRRGHCVHTFSIRRAEGECVGSEIRRERENTDYILDNGLARVFASVLLVSLTRFGRFCRVLWLALKVRPPGVKSLFWHIAYFAEASYLARRLIELQVQHLHNHVAENSATVAMLASELTGVPYSFTIHGPNEFYRMPLLAIDEKIARATFVACITSFCRSQCMLWSAPAEWHKLNEVHCACDASFLDSPIAPFPNEARIVTVGRLCAEKGHLVLIEALGRLAEEGLHFELEILGEGPMRSQLEAAIHHWGLGDSVHLRGWADSQMVRKAIEDSVALVLPSFAEGLPVVIMESLALGRPVVTSRIAGIPELVESGKHGWLVPASDVNGLRDALRELASTPTHRLREMGELGRLAVGKRHSIQSEVDKLEALFRCPRTSDLGGENTKCLVPMTTTITGSNKRD